MCVCVCVCVCTAHQASPLGIALGPDEDIWSAAVNVVGIGDEEVEARAILPHSGRVEHEGKRAVQAPADRVSQRERVSERGSETPPTQRERERESERERERERGTPAQPRVFVVPAVRTAVVVEDVEEVERPVGHGDLGSDSLLVRGIHPEQRRPLRVAREPVVSRLPGRSVAVEVRVAARLAPRRTGPVPPCEVVRASEHLGRSGRSRRAAQSARDD